MSRASPDREGGFWRLTLLCLAPPIAWAAHLGLVYGAQHILCASASYTRAWLWSGLALSLVIALLLVLLGWQAPGYLRRLEGDFSATTLEFLAGSLRVLALLSIVGIAWTGLGLIAFPGCAALA